MRHISKGLSVLSGWFLLGGALTAPGVAEPPVDATPASAHEILETAFTTRYELDIIATVELVMRNRAGHEQTRTFHVVSKISDDRLRGIARLTEPPYLRGMTFMTLEADNRRNDTFVYLPSVGRTRRISTSKRGDAFLGSDLTYEDFERQHVENYDLELRPAEMLGSEAVYVVRGAPRHRLNYHHVDFVVARSDHAILETRYYKLGAEKPYRIMVAPRESMTYAPGHVLPTRLEVANLQRGTTTDVVFHDLEINPPIKDTLFSVRTLEQKRDLPEVENGDPGELGER
ncbi:MAG: outer membrane lipoprotein-sorting protein [Deltaproteobacteria bacterium]|nr:MAG: outer membrane lipoprotein-sorting protein [Deltaproteobacteria bacterium]